MKKIVTVILLLLFVGCSRINPTFVHAVREHREDTVKVNESLIKAFQEEMAEETRPDVQDAYLEIINNLQRVSDQAKILDDYLWKRLTEDELMLVLKSKWREQP